MDEWLETFWGDLLSEEIARVLDAWTRIDRETQLAVRDHLVKMSTEEGWAIVQRDAAQVALDILKDTDRPDPLE